MVKAECTWGDGPDILLYNEGENYVLHEPVKMKGWKNGVSHKGSIALSVKEAKRLACDLMNAVKNVEELELQIKLADGIHVNKIEREIN